MKRHLVTEGVPRQLWHFSFANPVGRLPRCCRHVCPRSYAAQQKQAPGVFSKHWVSVVQLGATALPRPLYVWREERNEKCFACHSDQWCTNSLVVFFVCLWKEGREGWLTQQMLWLINMLTSVAQSHLFVWFTSVPTMKKRCGEGSTETKSSLNGKLELNPVTDETNTASGRARSCPKRKPTWTSTNTILPWFSLARTVGVFLSKFLFFIRNVLTPPAVSCNNQFHF